MAKLKDLGLPIGMDLVAETKLRKYFKETGTATVVLYQTQNKNEDGTPKLTKKGEPDTEIEYDAFPEDLVGINRDMYNDLLRANEIITSQRGALLQKDKTIAHLKPLADKHMQALKNRR